MEPLGITVSIRGTQQNFNLRLTFKIRENQHSVVSSSQGVDVTNYVSTLVIRLRIFPNIDLNMGIRESVYVTNLTENRFVLPTYINSCIEELQDKSNRLSIFLRDTLILEFIFKRNLTSSFKYSKS